MNNNPNVTFIYALCEPDTGMVRYVGKSDRPKRRYYHHLIDERRTHKVHWINQLKSQNKLPSLRIIEEVEKTDWEKAEIKWIAHYRSLLGDKLTNHTEGGDSPKLTPETCRKISEAKQGHLVSEETREKISKSKTNPSLETRKILSESHKGILSPGTLENLRKMAQARKGIPLNEGTKTKLSLANYGKKHSIETRKKLSEATTSYMNRPEIRQKQSIACCNQWKDPVYHLKRSEETKKLWQDPVFRAKRAASQKRFHEQKNKIQVLSCPE